MSPNLLKKFRQRLNSNRENKCIYYFFYKFYKEQSSQKVIGRYECDDYPALCDSFCSAVRAQEKTYGIMIF
jgi:hypothetical protein